MASSIIRRSHGWNVDVDRYIDRIVPPSPVYRLPAPIARFLGYRAHQGEDVGNIMGAVWSFMGAFCGLAVATAVFNNTASISQRHPPAMIASFGASAVLEYNAIRSPFGQPRNALLGHTFSALIGVAISKLFQFHSDYDSVKWIAGAISCGVASAVMLLTGTVHPPGGASAVLAATEPTVTAMGWYFVGLVLWGTMLMLLIGLVVNNIQRQFPVYWWTPVDLRAARKERRATLSVGKEVVDGKESSGEQKHNQDVDKISITAEHVSLPESLSLNGEEAKLLERLRARLRKRAEQSEVEKPHYDSRSARSSAECTAVPSRNEGEERSRSQSSG